MTAYTFFKTSCIRLFCIVLVAVTGPTAIAQDILAGLTSTGGKLSRGTAFSIKSTGTNFIVNKAFGKLGTAPEGDLIQGSDGNFYGMTARGGDYASFPGGSGTIFKMTPKGVITVLHEFNGHNGRFTTGNLIKGPDGNFWGMTVFGGADIGGTVFKITPSGVFTVVYNFIQMDWASNDKSGNPLGSLVLGKDGNFYGMTSRTCNVNFCGDSYGVVFKLTPAGVYTRLHTFTFNSGGNPHGSLVQGKDGNFYGMTSYGGGLSTAWGYGTIFKITPGGVFTRLVDLDFNKMGGYPKGSLVEGPDGWFYGMTEYGGPAYGNYGTIFKVSPTGQFILLHDLNSNAAVNGGRPRGSLLLAPDGNFYGITQLAGAYDAGTIFKMTPSGAITALHQFNPKLDGGNPMGSLIRASDGNFYGMTHKGGSSDSGTIFRMTPAGTFTVLANFPNDPSGAMPAGTAVQARDGNYYGFTTEGGAFGYGAVFKFCNGTYSVVRSLDGYTDGAFPKGDLVQGKDGNFYGMTYRGGKLGYGTIIKVTPTGTLTVLRSLNGKTDGANPWGGLVQGTDSSFYGMTVVGGASGYGTIFKITPSGTFTVLRSLNTATDGANPMGNLIQAKDGAFYGMTNAGGLYGSGTIFKITASGAFTVLRHFKSSTTDGSLPVGSLLQSTDGNLYGMTEYGGTYNYGTIFKISTTGAFTILYNINGTLDGFDPKGSLVRGSDGSFYGLNSSGGTYNGGSIFKVTPLGAFTVLRHLNPATDGRTPLGSLVIQKAAVSALPQNVTTAEDIAKAITLTNTGSGTSITYAVTTPPKNGSLNGTGSARTYIPKANFYGKDSFYFTTTWGCQTSAPAKVLITVTPVNDAPVLAAIGNKSITLGTTLSFTATATDVDASQTKTFTLVTPPAGAVINATSGLFTWKPTSAGTYSVKVRVTDNGSPALYDEEIVTVTVMQSLTTMVSAQQRMQPVVTTTKATLYPNPVADKFFVTLPDTETFLMMRIVDMNGSIQNRIISSVSDKNRIEGSATALPAGLYLVEIYFSSGKQTLKLVKQ